MNLLINKNFTHKSKSKICLFINNQEAKKINQ